MLDLNKLKKYKAKSDGTSLYKHTTLLLEILDELKTILNINKKLYNMCYNACLYHDIGKISDIFINYISGIDNQNYIRHEILSASVKNISDIERMAILTHHKSISTLRKRIEGIDARYKKEVNKIIKELNIDCLVDLKPIIKLLYNTEISKQIRQDKTAILVKGILNYCDHLASAGITKLDKGINFEQVYKFNSYTSIQTASKQKKEDIIIIGSTGSGKTEASLYFSNNIQNPEKSRRIYYILPYTASINAMYSRLKEQNISVGMLHGKASYFLYKELSEDIVASKTQYSIFKKFIKQVTVCTFYQIIKAFFECKFSEMMLSMYENSIFIIDEIHCFDLKEMSFILETLKYLKEKFNINICIMSASIPTIYLNLIKEKIGVKDYNVLKHTPKEYKMFKRHKVNILNGKIEKNLDKIKESILSRKKVLICVNTVKKAQNIRKELENFTKKNNLKLMLIHGKYNAQDREKIEKEILKKKEDLKEGEKEVSILIGTQAIEVSLNIDYDELFTELAPLDALLQRFGRINRKGFGKISEIKNVFVFDNIDGLGIYDENILIQTLETLKKINIIEEEKVQNYLDKVYKKLDREKYDNYAKDFLPIIKEYKLGEWTKDYIEKMLESKNVMVLPSSLKNKYLNYLEKGEYLNANALLVNISNKQYKMLHNNNKIKKEKAYGTNFIITTCKYTTKYGLEIEK